VGTKDGTEEHEVFHSGQWPCIPAFIDPRSAPPARARHALTMLGLGAGVRFRFHEIPPDGLHLRYADAPREGTAWLPASAEAWDFLSRKGAYDPARAADVRRDGLTHLRLFPAGGEHQSADSVASDIVAAAFFFLSQHAEWSSDARDMHGRFPARACLSGARGELDRPYVAEYATALRAMLERAGCELPPERSAGAVCLTHDIDYLSKFTPGILYREVVREFAGNRARAPFAQRLGRLRTYLGFAAARKDPYLVSLDRMLADEAAAGASATYFFKAGGRDKRDVTYSLTGARARRALRQVAAGGHETGLHPSYRTGEDAAMMQREAARLRAAAGCDIRAVRQHFLRFRYPDTWYAQAGCGLAVDSTLGFAEHEGFRSGACHPFLPWDLESDTVVPVWEVPLMAMDATLSYYRGLPPADALARVQDLLSLLALRRGTAAVLFHNVLHDPHDYPGWDGVYAATLASASAHSLATPTLSDALSGFVRTAGWESPDAVLQALQNPVL
jgi:hypothetical protein